MSVTLRKNHGFGLIQALFSTVLLSVFTLSGAHLLYKLSAQDSLTQASNIFITSVQQARALAIQNNQSTQLVANDFDWQFGWSLLENNAESLESFHFPKHLSVQAFDINEIQFRPNGMTRRLNPLGDLGLIICNELGQGRHLTMISSGYVSVKKISDGCGSNDKR
ncbi:MAG: GspH/FimT family pseudopilin [Kangiellaceae bacterium]|nr:GspH/FimT family pseudopilin [Kangiellaceae bacterium]